MTTVQGTTTSTPPWYSERRLETGGSPFTLRWDAGVTEDDLATISSLLLTAWQYEGDGGPMVVNIFRTDDGIRRGYPFGTGVVAFRANGTKDNIWLNLLALNPQNMAYIVLHEYYHSYAWHLSGGDRPLPTWISEGAADFFAYKALLASGLIRPTTFQANRDGRLQRVKATSETLTSVQFTTPIPSIAYDLGYFAMELLTSRHGDGRIVDYWRGHPGGDAWKQKFVVTFGVSAEDFNNEFESYRRSL